MKDSRQFWDDSAEKYVRSPIKDQAAYQKKLDITQEYLTSGSRVLEFGCGSGGTAIYYVPKVKSVLATDISGKMLEIAQQKAKQAGVDNITFRQSAVEDIDADPESFDAVLGLNVLHLLEDVDGAIAKVNELLKDEGIFVSSTPLMGDVSVLLRWLIAAMQLLGLAPHVTRLTRDQLVDKLGSAGFSIEKEWQVNRESLFVVARKTAKISA